MVKLILAEEGMSEALEGKLLISICAGVTMSQLKSWVHESTIVVRAMPNTPSKVCPTSGWRLEVEIDV
jgi:pyrroline-5-carboxylate reductase